MLDLSELDISEELGESILLSLRTQAAHLSLTLPGTLPL
jgi:hypothetical protein